MPLTCACGEAAACRCLSIETIPAQSCSPPARDVFACRLVPSHLVSSPPAPWHLHSRGIVFCSELHSSPAGLGQPRDTFISPHRFCWTTTRRGILDCLPETPPKSARWPMPTSATAIFAPGCAASIATRPLECASLATKQRSMS